MKQALKTPPTVSRLDASVSTPVSTGDGVPKSDRTGGDYGAGLIPGVSLCAVGEALGHGFWIDQTFIDSIAEAAPERLKSRFTHPSLCEDGTGKALGVIQDVSSGDGQAFGDLHFYASAHKSPDGDLAGYVMDFADESPEAFGLSIVFAHDVEAENDFQIENGAEWETDGYGFQYLVGFVSPDPDNVENFPHARLADLKAADVVDSPAANPDGLFHRKNELLSDANSLVEFVLGRSKSIPKLSSALAGEIAPERLRTFVSKYLAENGLSVVTTKGDVMTVKKTGKLAESKPADDEKPADDKKPDPKDDKKKDGEGKPDPKDAETDPAKGTEDDSAKDEDGGDANSGAKSKCDNPGESDMASKDNPDGGSGERETLAKFCSILGHEAGAKAFLDGKSLLDAMGEQLTSLRSDLADRNKKLEAFAKSGVPPVSGSTIPDKGRQKGEQSSKTTNEHGEELSARERVAMALAAKTEHDE